MACPGCTKNKKRTMPIFKCEGTECPFKEGCHRFTREDEPQQRYFMSRPLFERDAKQKEYCRFYMSNAGFKTQIKTKPDDEKV